MHVAHLFADGIREYEIVARRRATAIRMTFTTNRCRWFRVPCGWMSDA
jgi:hypothetical protein